MIKPGDITLTGWQASGKQDRVQRFLKRDAIDPKAELIAAEVLLDIRKNGDRAVLHALKKYEGASLKPDQLRVTDEEIKAAEKKVSVDMRRQLRECQRRVKAFAKAGLRKSWTMKSPGGGRLGEQFTPYDSVGAYIPGGAAPLASTALMTLPLASVAGVPRRIACTPAGKTGDINPQLLYAIHMAGATEIYKVGGIQAVGAMAFGTETIPRVQKIVGPGGPYVTAAKRLVYGFCDLDMVAGPSEIAVLADTSAKPAFVAADLLSQAEHGTGHEKVLLVTTSVKLARAVQKQLVKQAAQLSRSGAVEQVLKKGTLLVTVRSLEEGMDLCNRFAPEHFEIMVRKPRTWLKKVKGAGAVFLGPWSPEPAGDFAAGPSHVLPTGGTAAYFSGLSVDTFQRRSSVIDLTRKDLTDMLPVIKAFSDIEGLDAHYRSAAIRFDHS